MTAATPSPTVANGSVATQRPSPASGNAGEGRGPERWTAATEELVVRAKANHRTTSTDTGKSGPERYVWRCSCGSGRDKSAPVRWGVARDEMHSHEDRAILAELADAGLLLAPGGEMSDEWGVDHETFGIDGPVVSWNGAHEALARRMVAAAGSLKLVRRTVHTGPWIEVTDD